MPFGTRWRSQAEGFHPSIMGGSRPLQARDAGGSEGRLGGWRRVVGVGRGLQPVLRARGRQEPGKGLKETGIPPAGDASMGLASFALFHKLAWPGLAHDLFPESRHTCSPPRRLFPGPRKSGEVQNQIICLLPKASLLEAFGGQHPGPGPASAATNWMPATVQDKGRTLVARAEACRGRCGEGAGKWLLVAVGNSVSQASPPVPALLHTSSLPATLLDCFSTIKPSRLQSL